MMAQGASFFQPRLHMLSGFTQFRILSSKLSSLCELFDDLLSKQPKYDWSLSAIVPVLAAAGRAKLLRPDVDEEGLLVRVISDFNRSHLARVDIEVAEKILESLFSCEYLPEGSENTLDDSIADAIENSGLWLDDDFRVRVMQLHEVLLLRRCVFIVGGAGAGKTTVWETLKLARKTMDPTDFVNRFILYPNVFSSAEFYGHFDPLSSQWKDGALTSTLKYLGASHEDDNTQHESWLVLDGEICFGQWADSLNSVMDETGLLTLASNERIPLPPSTHLLFEVSDLRFASPSTLNRGAVLYISDDKRKQWRCVAACWVQSQSDEILSDKNRSFLATLFETYVAPTLDFLRENASVVIGDVALVETLLVLLQIMLTPGILGSEARLEAMFAFCCVWSLGAVHLEIDGRDCRKAFSDWFRRHFGKQIRMPEKNSVFDYWLEPDSCVFETWRNSPSFASVSDFDSIQMDMNQVTVPTIQTASVTFWINHLVKLGRPVSVVGPSNAGKSRLVALALDNTKKATRRINLDYVSSSAMLQERIASYMTKHAPNTLGPAGLKGKLLLFVDDMNLAPSSENGLRATDEFMRQLVEQSSWFDIGTCRSVSVVETQYITCTTSINPRAQRHYSTFAIPSMSGSSMLTIFQTFVEAHFRKLPFSASVCDLVPDLLKATLAVHKEASAMFRKSAADFFCGFDVNHVSRVVQGLLMAQPQGGKYDSPENVVRLWCHEVERSYGDVLLTDTKIFRLRELARSIAKISFLTINTKGALGEADRNSSQSDSRSHRTDCANVPSCTQICFSHITDVASLKEPSYECVQNLEKMQVTLETALKMYNEGPHPKIGIELFEESLLHTVRLARILMQPFGHALLFGGIGGAGRRTTARLVAYLCGLTLTQPKSRRVEDFVVLLKELLMQTGVRRERVLLLLPESQIVDDHILALVSELLAFGCVSRLFNDNEKKGIASILQATGAAMDGAIETCLPIFVRHVRSNLRVVFTASPLSSTFRELCRRFPAILKFTKIDSFLPWSRATLEFIAEHHVKNCADLFVSSPPGFIDVALRFCPQSHQLAVACRINTVLAGPKNYLEMLTTFENRLAIAKKESSNTLCRLESAIDKVRDAARSLETLEHDVQVWQKDADFKEELCQKLAEQVKKTTVVVERQMILKETKTANYHALQAEFEQICVANENETASAAPIVDELSSALDTLRRDEIGDCAAMITPPPGVGNVFGAVIVLLAGINTGVIVQKNGKVLENDRTWEACKESLLSNVNGFIEELTKFKSLVEESSVPKVNFLEVRPFILDENFTEEAIADQLPVAATLVRWVRSVVAYNDRWLDIKPVRVKMVETEKRLDRARVELEKQTHLFEKLGGELDNLKTELEKAEGERVTSAEKVRRGRLKFELGQRLVDALEVSTKEWTNQVESLKSKEEQLVSEVLIASAFVSYCGPLDPPLRHNLVFEKWIPLLEISASSPTSILSLLASENDVIRWESELATNDPKLLENAAIVSWSRRWPLLIDPQKHGIAWLKAHCRTRETRFVATGQQDILTVVADAIASGHVLIFEKIVFEDIVVDPALHSVFQKSCIEKSKRKYVRLVEETEFNEAFQLFAQTTQCRPNIPLELQDEMTVIDFSLTERGLENHLAKRILHATSPHLAVRRIEISRLNFQTRLRIHDIQCEILARLDNQVEPAEDRELVDKFELLASEKKALAVDLDDRIRHLERGLDALTDRYRPVACRGAALFTLMKGLKSLNSHYVYGINLFVGLFTLGVERALAADKRKVTISSKLKLMARRAARKQSASSWNDDLLLKPILDDASKHPFERFHEVAKRVVVDKQVKPRSEQNSGTSLPPIRRGSELAEGEELRHWRNERMMLSVTQLIYRHIERGVFARDRLTVATLLAFLLAGESCVGREDITYLVTRRQTPTERKAMGAEVSSWLPGVVWNELVALSENVRGSEKLESLARIVEEIVRNSSAWRSWYEHPTPEILLLPGKLNIASDMAKLCIIRVVRPDRLPEAMRDFNERVLGQALSGPLHSSEKSLRAIYSESTSSRPILFFMSSDSEDLESRIQGLGRDFDYSTEKGTFLTLSLGCVPAEERANNGLDAMSLAGGWLLLQNIDLSPSWLSTLEKRLELASGTASINFRCFLTIAPEGRFDLLRCRTLLSESLLVECVKVNDEVAPSSDLNVNMQRAWLCFDQELLESCQQSKEYTRCLVGLCFFHSLLVYRRRFSNLQGWSQSYCTSTTTIKICARTIKDVLNGHASVPWDFLRHIIVEGHYAGSVNSTWEGKVVEACASTIFDDFLLEPDAMLASDCPTPDIAKTDISFVENHITTDIPSHSLDALCLNDMVEAHYNLDVAEHLIETLSCFACLKGTVDISRSDRVLELVESWQRGMPRKFSMSDLCERSSREMGKTSAPYVEFLQSECERANALIGELARSLEATRRALRGQGDHTLESEELVDALAKNKLPGVEPTHNISWISTSWPTHKTALEWFRDLVARIEQLRAWEAKLELPPTVRLTFFRPRAFLATIKIFNARVLNLPLDQMAIESHVSTVSHANFVTRPTHGAYLRDLYCQGACWGNVESHKYTIDNVLCAGNLTDLSHASGAYLPLVYVSAGVAGQRTHHHPTMYDCPVYLTRSKRCSTTDTFVFAARLYTDKDLLSILERKGTSIFVES